MASVGEVAERVARVVELAGRCRAALVVARDSAEDAFSLPATSLRGAEGLEADAAEALRSGLIGEVGTTVPEAPPTTRRTASNAFANPCRLRW
ncbi:hypothetical protein [Actinosynnema sp.]|uniref:hypothetical protein n=1 Tax=Actinosynnema sp. TaxID=1872144 RepID=UPI003F82AEFC